MASSGLRIAVSWAAHDLHVAGGPDLQAVDREQGEGDVAESFGDATEFGDEQGVAGEVDGASSRSEHVGDLGHAALGRCRRDADSVGLGVLPGLQRG
jgi:hypothetical protein